MLTESGFSRLLTVSRDNAGDTVVVSAAGEIDITSVGELRAALADVVATAEIPVIDLSAVHFMGSVGLSVLLELVEKVSPARLRVVVSPEVRRPIEITELDKVVLLFDALEPALRHR